MAELQDTPRLIEVGNFEVAQQLIDEALDLNPDNEEALGYQEMLVEAQNVEGEDVEEGVDEEVVEGEEADTETELDFAGQVGQLLDEFTRLEDSGEVAQASELLVVLIQALQEKVDTLQGTPQETSQEIPQEGGGEVTE